MKKWMFVFGTRPEAIKMAPLIKSSQSLEDVKTIVCVTAQHREMLDQVLDVFDIVPDVDLDIMGKGQDLYDISSRVLLGMRSVLEVHMPDVIFVHGDTSTSMIASLAAFYKQIPVAHVEAGLRTWNMKSPWPEEANRVITARLASYHFAPTKIAKENLEKEGITKNVFVTGNTVIDALLLARKMIESKVIDLPGRYKIDASTRRMVLITGHRRENFGEGFEHICVAIKQLAESYPNVDFVYPVHLNPNVREPVQRILGQSNSTNIFLIEPLSYLPFVALMNRSTLILTDSGGIQEEAPSLGKPVLVMRDTTERPEAVTAGTAKVIGTTSNAIVEQVSKLLDDERAYCNMSTAKNPYGDGHACHRIIEIMRNEK